MGNQIDIEIGVKIRIGVEIEVRNGAVAYWFNSTSSEHLAISSKSTFLHPIF
jgi:hypothetical protein